MNSIFSGGLAGFSTGFQTLVQGVVQPIADEVFRIIFTDEVVEPFNVRFEAV